MINLYISLICLIFWIVSYKCGTKYYLRDFIYYPCIITCVITSFGFGFFASQFIFYLIGLKTLI